MTQGFAVSDDTKQKLSAKTEPETPVKEPEGDPGQDAIDKIIAGIETEAGADLELEEEPEVEEMPDFEAEAERQLLDEEIAEVESGYEPEEEEQPVDSNARKRAIIAEKKASYYENLRAQDSRKKWEVEAAKHFPFSTYAFPKITATSRRGFLRDAKAAHEAVKPFIKSAVQKREEELQAERAKLREQEQAKAQDAWGKPTNAPSTPAGRYEAEMEKARQSGDLAERIAVMMKAGQGEET
jgi:hypothetical protein